ncbi:MAG: UvrB/UvrC motif-containing protein [Planctomycetota bacterium]
MPTDDLTAFLEAWPHESGRVNARLIDGDDSRPKLQVRIDLGVLQLERDGRPDGQRPHGAESLFRHHQQRHEVYVRDVGASAGFVLSPDECRALREEAVQLYHRYVALFALQEYALVIRDTTESIAMFDFCRDYAADPRDRMMLEQFRPGVIMTRTRAEAELAVANNDARRALDMIDRGLNDLRAVYDEHRPPGEFEQLNEVQLLRGMRDALVPKLPMSPRAELIERLRAAIDAENYELAAILRDELRIMRD